MLEDDTGKTINGCKPGVLADQEVNLTSATAGLAQVPPIGVTDTVPNPDCGWTASDIAKWRGPYINAPVDPWGRAYRFDPDYALHQGCDTLDESETDMYVVIHSWGQSIATDYDCDDIYIMLQ